MNLEKIKRLLGLARRSNNLMSGEDSCLKAIKKGKASLVIISEDASDNTFKRISDKCSYRKIVLLKLFNRYELGSIIGKKFAVVLAVIDINFSNGILSEVGGIPIAKEKSV